MPHIEALTKDSDIEVAQEAIRALRNLQSAPRLIDSAFDDQSDRIRYPDHSAPNDVRIESRLSVVAPCNRLQHPGILFRCIGIDVHHHAARIALRHADQRLISIRRMEPVQASSSNGCPGHRLQIRDWREPAAGRLRCRLLRQVSGDLRD